MQIGLEQLISHKLGNRNKKTRQNESIKKSASSKVKQPDLRTKSGLRAARQARMASNALSDRNVIKQIVQVDDKKASIRIIEPKEGESKGVFFNIPGGGFYLNEAPRSDAYNALLADSLGMTVISIEYRLAPENPWPAAPDDCETVALWLIEQYSSQLGTERLIIGGSSAGATLALVVLLRLKSQNLAHKFSGVVLQFGAYDLSGQTPGGRLYSDEYFIQAYTGDISDKSQPDISPLYGNVRDLPSFLMVVGTEDILMEDTFAMSARLSASGNEVDLKVYPEAKHGFTTGSTEMAEVANRDIIEWIKRR